MFVFLSGIIFVKIVIVSIKNISVFYIVCLMVFGIVLSGFLFFLVVILISFVFWNEKLIVIMVINMVLILWGNMLWVV